MRSDGVFVQDNQRAIKNTQLVKEVASINVKTIDAPIRFVAPWNPKQSEENDTNQQPQMPTAGKCFC